MLNLPDEKHHCRCASAIRDPTTGSLHPDISDKIPIVLSPDLGSIHCFYRNLTITSSLTQDEVMSADI